MAVVHTKLEDHNVCFRIGETKQVLGTYNNKSQYDRMFSQNPSINTYTYNKAADDAILKCLFPL